MASRIELTFSEMRNRADQLAQWNRKLRDQTSTMRGHQQRLTASWDGVANDEFDRQFNSDMRHFDLFFELIEKYIQTLRAAADEYEHMENANKQIANQRTYGGRGADGC